MNRRLVTVMGFALVVSGLASLAVYRMLLSSVAQASARPLPQYHLIVAAHDLPTGSLITASDLKTVNVASPSLSQVITETAQAVGRGVVAPVFEGEPIHLSRLAPAGAGAGLSSMIPVGMRAVAMRVDQVVGLAGFVVPGMRVDVLVSGSGGNGNVVTRTVLQNIEVLSAGQKYDRSLNGKPEEAQVVNLLVSPAQAETLTLAGTETKVQLVLRNPLDKEESKTPGTSLASVLGIPATMPQAPMQAVVAAAQPAPAVFRPAPESDTVEVFSGTKRADQAIISPAKVVSQ